MSVAQKVYTSSPISNGLATVSQGDARPATYDAKDRNVDIPSGDSLTLFQTLDGRYKVHGGPGGSGSWEH